MVPINDEELIAIGYEAGVPPIMVLAPMNEEMNFDTQIAHNMFINQEGQNRLIDNIITTMGEGIYRSDIDFEFIVRIRIYL